MNPVEIEEAVSRIAEAPFNPGEFPFDAVISHFV